MDKFTRKISNQIAHQVQNLHENLENLLDLDRWSPPTPKKQFEIQTQFQELKNIRLQSTKIDDLLIQTFSHLAPYFESGLLLYRKQNLGNKETWVHGAAFHEGVYFHIPEDLTQLTLELPRLQNLELKKCTPY